MIRHHDHPRASVDEVLVQFFEEAFQERLHRSSQMMTTLGMKRDQDKLDDLSDARQIAGCEVFEDQLRQLECSDYAQLRPANQNNYRLSHNDAQCRLKRFHYRLHGYLITQKFGRHTDFQPS